MSSPGATNPSPGVADQATVTQDTIEDVQVDATEGEDEPEEEAEDGQSEADEENAEEGGEAQDGEDDQPPAAAADEVEIEHEGEKFKIPAKLKDAFLKNADYTQKTQQLAADRKELQARQERAVATIKERGQLYAIHDQIEAYKQVNWDALQQQDAEQGTHQWAHHWQKFTMLKEQAGDLAQTIHNADQEAQATSEREAATRLANAVETCTKEIPGFNAAYAQQLADLAVSKLGYSKQEVAGIDDPRVYKALHLLSEADKAAKTAAKVQRHLKPQQTQPAPQAKPGGAKPTPKDPNKMSMPQYEKWRAAQA